MNVLPSAPEYDATQTQPPQQQTLYPMNELAQLSAEDFRLKKINDLLKELSDEAEHYRQVAKKSNEHTPSCTGQRLALVRFRWGCPQAP